MDCPINWPTEANYSNLYKNLDVHDEIKLEYYQSLYLPNSIYSILDFIDYLEDLDVSLGHLQSLYLPLTELERKFRLSLNKALIDEDGINENILPQGIRDRLEYTLLINSLNCYEINANDFDRKNWIKCLELREKFLQVSILMYLLSRVKTDEEPSTKKRKKKINNNELVNDYDNLLQRLEFAIDRLVLWQTLNMTSLTQSKHNKDSQNDRSSPADEVQKFYKHTIDIKFRKLLPKICKSFKLKCFGEDSSTNNKNDNKDDEYEFPLRVSSVKPHSSFRSQTPFDVENDQISNDRPISRQPSVVNKMFASRVVGISKKSNASKDKVISKSSSTAFEVLSKPNESHEDVREEKTSSTLVLATPSKKTAQNSTNSNVFVAESPAKLNLFDSVADTDDEFEEHQVIPDTPQKKKN